MLVRNFNKSAINLIHLFLFLQSGQLDLKHFDPEFVREPVPGENRIYYSRL